MSLIASKAFFLDLYIHLYSYMLKKCSDRVVTAKIYVEELPSATASVT